MKKALPLFFILAVLIAVGLHPLPAPAASAETVKELSAAASDSTAADSALSESISRSAADKASRRDKSLPASPKDPGYLIRAGDVLQITVWKEEDMDREALVLPDGTISFPLIGSFSVAGMTPAQVQGTVKRKLSGLIPDASVNVVVKAALGNTVSIIGQVAKPGEIVMGQRLSVMQALSQAGGLTPYASEDEIIILRQVDGKETSIPFPYDAIAAGRDLEKNIPLRPGDVVVVPTATLF